MCGAVFVWKAAYRRALGESAAFITALLSFVVSFQLIYYSSELKSYSMDVLAAGAFCLFLWHQKDLEFKNPSKGLILCAVLMPLLLAFSYAAFFIFWIPAYNFIIFSRKNKALLPLSAWYIGISLAVSTLVYFFDIRFGLSESCLLGYWESYFICSASPYCFIKSFGEGLRNIVAWPFGDDKLFIRTASFFIPFFAIGTFYAGVKCFKKAKEGLLDMDTIGFVIFAELFVLGLLKKYPFTGERITLFFMPVVFFLIMRGISAFKRFKPLYASFTAFYVSFLVFCGFNSLVKFFKLFFKL
ncbi:MAG: hypothetical protein PHR11_00905 [Candidatus Omnitrophica bacterium]|nr:hypothetical protein [Candidatus Omnitrophota bacterium]